MNIYAVVSETLIYREPAGCPYLPDGCEGPPEPYEIACLVAAPKRSRAVFLAWKSDADSFTGDFRDCPKFRCKLARKGVEIPEGIVPDGQHLDCWDAFYQEA